MKIINEIGDLSGKKVLLRVDFDVPIGKDSVITDPFRILKQKSFIDDLINKGARVVMMGHTSTSGSFAELMPQLHILLGREIGLISHLEQLEQIEHLEQVVLFDNIRKFSGEMKNDEGLALSLSKGFDIYINNAFAVCHRKHASVSAITKFLPSYGGPLLEEETSKLKQAVQAPAEGKVIIIGGAKAATKVPVIKNFLDKAEKILLGGVVANDFLKAKGVDVRNSIIDDNYQELLAGLDLNNPMLLAPKDFNIFENKILDIGQETAKEYSEIIKNSKMIVWNGPMGMFENDRFASGTRVVAEAIADSTAFKVAGGGDTIAAINKFGLAGKFDFISIGGGAMLEFLAGNRLPGLDALGYYS